MREREGTTFFAADGAAGGKGPASKKAGFYNPAMALDRDLCVLFCEHAAGEGCTRFLDGLGATGIRGIRVANEVDADIEVTVNDVNPVSCQAIRDTAASNGVDVTICNEDVRVLLSRERYDYVDIDPYGSPAPFVHAALDGLYRRGYLAVTATDKATLCGVHPKACRRRYDAVPRRGMAMKELGLRILLGYLVRAAAGRDYGAAPVFAYSYDHYFRVYLRLHKGARRGDASLDHVGWAGYDDGWHLMPYDACRMENWAGPLWTGPLHDAAVVAAMLRLLPDKTLAAPRKARRLLESIAGEIDAPPFYYEGGELGSRHGLTQPPIAAVLESLRSEGYRAARTHFTPDAIKTDAPESVLVSVFERLG
ncbi:MAG: tRNA (guanine(26)-N(2))-dimethyltransferase [Thermoplasmatota archaeon]